MPLITVHLLHSEGTLPSILGEVSYEHGSTLKQFRGRLDKIGCIPRPYEFWSSSLGRRIPEALEEINAVADYTDIFVILRSSDSGLYADKQYPINDDEDHSFSIASSGADGAHSRESCGEVEVGGLEGTRVSLDASNEPQSRSNLSSYSSSNPSNDINQAEKGFDIVANAPWWPRIDRIRTEFHVEKLSDFACKQHGSKEMPDALMKEWLAGIYRLVAYMDTREEKDQRWIAVTWDEQINERKNAQVALVCVECQFVSSAMKPGFELTKLGILNCFTNFQSKHLTTKKHQESLRKKRVRPTDHAVDDSRSPKKPKDDRALVEAGIEIMQGVTAKLAVDAELERETFYLRGDIDKVPCVGSDFTVSCSFCGNVFALCPRQNTLRHNLMQHAASADHQKKVARGSATLFTG